MSTIRQLSACLLLSLLLLLHTSASLTTTTTTDNSNKKTNMKLLMVCLGNINRSPTAEAVMKHTAAELGLSHLEADSCGTGGGSSNWYKPNGFSYHEGETPAYEMTKKAKARGYTLTGSSRPLTPQDLDTFDVIVGMDPSNVRAIFKAADYWKKLDIAKEKTILITDYCTDKKLHGTGVPDPYYDTNSFDTVLDILIDACKNLSKKLLAEQDKEKEL